MIENLQRSLNLPPKTQRNSAISIDAVVDRLYMDNEGDRVSLPSPLLDGLIWHSWQGERNGVSR